MTQWRIISRFPDYEVSDVGDVRRRTPGPSAHIGKPRVKHLDSNGRPRVTLSVGDGRWRAILICQLVCEAFNGPKPFSEAGACHCDGNNANNEKVNLRWGSRLDNMADMIDHNRSQKGERHHNARLTQTQVNEIRSRYSNGDLQRNIAVDFGIRQSHVSRIVSGARW